MIIAPHVLYSVPWDLCCLPFESVCVCLRRWPWLYDDNTLWGCPKSIKSKPKRLPPVSTGCFKGWYWLVLPFGRGLGARWKRLLEKWRDDNAITAGGTSVDWPVMLEEGGSWMSETNGCIIINSASSREPNACHNTQVLQRKGQYTNYSRRNEGHFCFATIRRNKNGLP